jgi:hypothetical protein
VHSGSRALGAAVYGVVAEARRFLSGGSEVASGEMALFYQRAFDALNKFAKLNLVLCALAVLDATGHETGVAEMQAAMRASPLFAPAIARAAATDAATLALLSGVVHNGVACFMNDELRTALFVLKKGAIAMTRGATASVVALRAGDGCVMWTLADARCAAREADIREGVERLGAGFAQVYESPDVLYSGHGAGRARATNQTAKLSTFADVAAFHKEAGVVGNIAPGLLGDNPRIAYNDVPTIIARLPLAQACTHAQLKTVVAFKEGISQARPDVQACADYIVGGLRRLHCRRLAGRLGHGEALSRPGTCASRAWPSSSTHRSRRSATRSSTPRRPSSPRSARRWREERRVGRGSGGDVG